MTSIDARSLAINGGAAAAKDLEGTPLPKIGIDEFLEVADTWGFSANLVRQIRELVKFEDQTNPRFTRYFNRRPSKVAKLEAQLSTSFDMPYVLAVNSGTSAVYAAYIAVGVGPGDEIIVPAYTFPATASAALMVGAMPVIAEVDESLTLDPGDVAAKITSKTRAVVAVHIGGACADMKSMVELADRHGVALIEDVAQACGATYRGQRLGTFGAVGSFSLNGFKHVGGGEGGFLLTHDERYYRRALNIHDVGAAWRLDSFRDVEDVDNFFGFNLRMSELEGAVDLVQVLKMDERIGRYRLAKQRVVEQLGSFEGIVPQVRHDRDGELADNLVFFTPNAATAAKIADALVAEGVPAGARSSKDWHSYASWDQLLRRRTPFRTGFPWTHPKGASARPEYAKDMCPRTLELLDRAVHVSIGPHWTAADCVRIAEAINKVLDAFCGLGSGCSANL
ncbi:DegT/DnrJ/EryC1/StrS family aminotransferase [Kribbella sp. NPDC051587]|uniref:DegT/DnrJ/EryC1/StrS family aminotransferase n=1 Tax=Kribbella sp. NPDC051587 TaxID=3364119 RepID=UPI0037A41AB6